MAKMSLHPKVANGVIAGAIMTVVTAELSRRGITLAPEEAGGLTVLAGLAIGYWTPNDDGDGAADQPQEPVPLPAPAPGPPVGPLPAPQPLIQP